MNLLLDCCCGEKAWLRTQQRERERAISIDLLASVSPHVVASAVALPFRSNIFDRIICDPPHLIRGDWLGDFNKTYLKYGRWKTRREWETFLRGAAREWHRVSKQGAWLVLKIIDGPDRRVTKRRDLQLVARRGWRLVYTREHKSKVTWSRCTTIYAYYRRL